MSVGEFITHAHVLPLLKVLLEEVRSRRTAEVMCDCCNCRVTVEQVCGGETWKR